MDKKPRLGSDPLEWIKNTRKDPEGTGKSKQSKHSLQRLQGELRKQIKQSIPVAVKRGLQPGWTRATFIVRDGHLDKVKALANWERKEIKEVIDEALQAYLKGKSVKPIKKEGA